jgi:tetratricopeptide (TPR) repeat protein
MKLCIFIAGVLAPCLAAAPAILAQQPPATGPAQSSPAKPAPDTQKPAQNPPQSSGNPFPEDTATVPVMPNAKTAAQPEPEAGDAAVPVALPAQDFDPARSPDDADTGAASSSSSSSTESSSSVPDMDRLQPKDDEDAKRKGKGKDAPEFHETAANDIDVGNFELQRKNWKGALSRFQSAMVLDPENPEAFWGMAEAARHLGDFASARSYYQKVADYDPDSRHGKDAQKALKEPEIANAQNAAKGQPQK